MGQIKFKEKAIFYRESIEIFGNPIRTLSKQFSIG